MSAPPAPTVGRRSSDPGAALLAVVALVLWVMVLGASPVAAEPAAGRWQWPSSPPHQVLHGFEQPEHRYAAGHRGVDLMVHGGAGAPVRAVEDGTVRFAGDVAGRGVVSVMHADGLISTYEPVMAKVRAGQSVAVGDLLGDLAPAGTGGPHCPEGPCLHLGARRGEDYLDPLLLLGARGPSVLLPWGGAEQAEASRTRPVSSPEGSRASSAPAAAASGAPRHGLRRALLD